MNRELAAAAVAESARKGYVDGQALAACSRGCAQRPGVGLRGQQLPARQGPPAFDILYWNQDTVRLAAGLHRDFMRSRWRTRSRGPAG